MRLTPVLALLTVPLGAVAAPLLGAAFTLGNIVRAARSGALPGLVAVLNIPFDLLTNSLGFFSEIGFYPLYAGRAEHPEMGRRSGSLIFIGGPAGQAVAVIASGFTPTSTVFLARRAWDRLGPDQRDRLINHELWHARQQFGRYTGWLFWPAYLASNLIWGTHRKNPFESGRRGAYRCVDDRWETDFKGSSSYLECSDPFWRRTR